ncbi:EndoU domain-containing protein [Mycobacterium talmoniae]|uniref:Bacterial EndoU nuclease domain-containing protein n=1 Tax=Mycobacterium talmoniae TaxID=1858794 RepID=A0A2S8BKF4_9MYCO|nr:MULTISPECIES: EndoU domain-containing protein [Mycobacterium]PQM47109.1 hypothetical protein C1Y40_02717 [Mycobacterium talmoniae]
MPFTPDNAPKVTDAQLAHILVGKPKKNGWSGGHGFGAGKGKSEFPESWDRTKIRDAIDQVLVQPAEIIRKGSTLYFRASVDGLPLAVRVKGRVHGRVQVWTAYPDLPIE